ncbi:MAG: signal peptidase II [Parachlamydiaceae bacterium]
MRFSGRLCLFIGFLILVLDAFSKHWVHVSLPVMSSHFPSYPYGGIPVFKDFLGIEFSLTHITNRGAAWGVLNGFQESLVGLRILLILAMLGYVLFYHRTLDQEKLPLTLIIAGAAGNVMDYFVYGHVVDMFHFVLWGYSFPVFNIADSSVCIGIAWLIGLSLFQKTSAEENC